MVQEIEFKSRGLILKGRIGGLLDQGSGVILLHGLTNNIDDCPNLRDTEEILWENNISTLSFDFFGSGKSPGKMREKTILIMLENVNDAIDFFKTNYNIKRMGLWGRSVGGSLSILAYEKENIQSVVLLSTSVSLTRDFSRFEEIAKKQAKMEKEGGSLAGTGNYKGSFKLNLEFFNELPEIDQKIAQNLPLMKNVLVLATDPDNKVPLDNAEKIKEILRDNCKLKVFYNTNHAYNGVEKEAVDLIKEWFVKTLL